MRWCQNCELSTMIRSLEELFRVIFCLQLHYPAGRVVTWFSGMKMLTKLNQDCVQVSKSSCQFNALPSNNKSILISFVFAHRKILSITLITDGQRFTQNGSLEGMKKPTRRKQSYLKFVEIIFALLIVTLIARKFHYF